MSDDAIFISQTKLALRWGMTVRTIQRKRKQPGFPKPDLYFGDIPHWRAERIGEFERNLMREALGESKQGAKVGVRECEARAATAIEAASEEAEA